MAMALFLHLDALLPRLHLEIASADIEDCVAGFEPDLFSSKRQNEVCEPQVSAFAAHNGPLLCIVHKRAIQTAADATFKEKFTREFRGHGFVTYCVLELRDHLAGHAFRQFPVHGPEGEPDAIPPQISEAAERLEVAAPADV